MVGRLRRSTRAPHNLTITFEEKKNTGLLTSPAYPGDRYYGRLTPLICREKNYKGEAELKRIDWGRKSFV